MTDLATTDKQIKPEQTQELPPTETKVEDTNSEQTQRPNLAEATQPETTTESKNPEQAQELNSTEAKVEDAIPAEKPKEASQPKEITDDSKTVENKTTVTELIEGAVGKVTSYFKPNKPIYLKGLNEYSAISEAVVGLKHCDNVPALPCQDSASATIKPRPILIVCDGAGSSAVSEIGSSALTVQLTRLCQSLDPILPELLDKKRERVAFEDLVRIIIRHTMGTLSDLSILHRRPVKDFRSTLNFALVGLHQILWIKVGDGEIIQEKILEQDKKSELTCLGEITKGEFANQTVFVDDKLKMDDVQWGILKTEETMGLALMSDGSAEKLVSLKRDKVAPQITVWLDILRQGKLKVRELHKRFYADTFTSKHSGDDCSIALLAQKYEE